MSADIQEARDVLKKWRDAATPGQWAGTPHSPGLIGVGFGDTTPEYAATMTAGDARLIVGTAGNPALWDAIDGMLATAAVQQFTGPVDRTYQTSASLIAAAILSAEERMNA